MPKLSKETAEAQDFGLAVDCKGELDGYSVSFVTIRETHELAEVLKGLPDDRCQCPHWGYVFKGRVTIPPLPGSHSGAGARRLQTSSLLSPTAFPPLS